MITKKDLQIFGIQLEKRLEKRLEKKLDQKLEEKLEEKFGKYNDPVMTMLSNIMGEIQAMREEMTVFAYRQAKHSDKLEDHEKRIISLEK